MLNSGRLAGLFLLAALWVAPHAWAAKVVLTIRTGEPIGKSQKVQISTNLPPRVTPNDILSLDGLALSYDVKSSTYYVHKDLELGPKEIKVFKVEINDIWEIPSSRIASLRKRVGELAGKLRGEDRKSGETWQQEIEKSLGLIESSQAQNALRPGEKITAHLKTYDSNIATMKRVLEAVGRIENLVIDSGEDPGGDLIGEIAGLAIPKREAEGPPQVYRAIINRITALNRSPTETKSIPVRRELPSEIKLEDILDTGGLESGQDAQKGICYVSGTAADVPPGKSVSFDVKIRDKWNVNGPRIVAVRSNATVVLSVVSLRGGFKSIEDTLNSLIVELDKMEKEAGPEELSDKYVAFYRYQSARLDLIDQKVMRVESALRTKPKGTKIGTKIKPPTIKSTWMIIYIILGFLAVMSLLFFLRWFGKSGAEKMDDTTQGGTGT